jgi:hypothetical protein
MKDLIRFLAALALASIASIASAQIAQPASVADPYYGMFLPQPGAYYDPSQPGSGVFVDVGSNGTMFVSIFHHDADGSPSFHTMQGAFVPTYAYPTGTVSQTSRPKPANVGTFRSPLYLTTGGDCISCPYRGVTTVPDYMLGEGEIVWTTTRRAKLTVGPRTLNLQMLNIDRAEADLVVGQWLLGAWEGQQAASAMSTVSVEPTDPLSISYVLPCCIGAETVPYPLPSADAKFYRVTCTSSCESFDAWRANVYGRKGDVFVWFEPATGLAVLDQLFPNADGTYEAAIQRQHYELSLDEDLISGRASYRGRLVFINTNNAVPIQGALVRMMRLPTSS